MRPRRSRRFAVAALPLLVLSACGSGSGGGSGAPPVAPVTLTAATTRGLSYTLTVTSSGKDQCMTASYRSEQANGQLVTEGSHVCGAAAEAGHPVLIQAHASPESMVTDVSARGCRSVEAGPTHAMLRPVVTHCTAGATVFRVTILPKTRRQLVIVGIPGAPVINFPRHVCKRGICVTPLA